MTGLTIQQQPLSNVGLWAEDDELNLSASLQDQDSASFSKVDAWPEVAVSQLIYPPGTDLFGNLGAGNVEDERYGYSGTNIYLDGIRNNMQMTFPSDGPSTCISTQDDLTTVASAYDGAFSETASWLGVPQFGPEHRRETSGHSQLNKSYYQPVDNESLLSWDLLIPAVEPTDQEKHQEYTPSSAFQPLASAPSPCTHPALLSPETDHSSTAECHPRQRRPSSTSHRKPNAKSHTTNSRSSPTIPFQYDDPDIDAQS